MAIKMERALFTVRGISPLLTDNPRQMFEQSKAKGPYVVALALILGWALEAAEKQPEKPVV